jgi:hypothetical protein
VQATTDPDGGVSGGDRGERDVVSGHAGRHDLQFGVYEPGADVLLGEADVAGRLPTAAGWGLDVAGGAPVRAVELLRERA